MSAPRTALFTGLFAGVSTLAFAAAAQAADIQPWGIILQGDSIRVGINSFGTFGNGNEYGAGINFDRSGTGTFDYAHDFLAPGSPFDSFSLGSGSTLMVENNNDEWYTDQNIAGTLTDFSGVARNGTTFDNRVVWTGTMGDVAIEHDYFFNRDDLQVNVRTTITALTDLSDLYFARSVDPDAVVEPGDDANTVNSFGIEGRYTYVYGEATVSRYLLGLVTDGAGTQGVVARSNNSWGFATNFPTEAAGSDPDYTGMDPQTLYTLPDSDPAFNANGTTSDDIIALAFKLGALATGDSISFLYSYVFGNDIETFVHPVADQAGTETSLAGTAAVTRATLSRAMAALQRLTQQETPVRLAQNSTGLTLSTKGGMAEHRLALRLGALAQSGGTGDQSLGSVTGAYRIDDRLTAGISFERGTEESADQGYSSRADMTTIAAYLRSRDDSGEGLTWKLAFGQSTGDITIDRAAGVVGAEAGTGTARLRAQSASAELGYAFRPRDGLLLAPFLRLSQTEITRAAYSEAAGIAFPLSFDAARQSRSTVTLGLDAALQTGPQTALTLGAGVEHDLQVRDDALTGTSTIPGLASFTTDMTGPLDRTRGHVTASLRHVFDDGSSLLVTGRLGEDAYSSSLNRSLGLNYEIRF